MEPPSGPASRRHVPWNRLLLAVSLLTFGTLPTTAQLTIEVVPPLAAEGTDILLLAHNVTKNSLGCTWYSGERVENSQLIASYRADTNVTTKGPAHSGRETLYPNGTLLIQHVTQKDTGSYTLLILKNDLRTERQTGHLHVHPVLPTPVITSNNSSPWEHKDTVVLTCGPETQDTSYMWWINDQSLPSSTRLELSEDKRTLTVFSVTRKDTGPYVCEARNPVSVRRSDPFTLQVLYPVARPSLQASNTTVAEHEGPVVLTCLTDETGVSIRWFFKGQSLLLTRGMTLSLDNSTLTIDPVSRKDAGDYECEVSNRANSSKSDPHRLSVTWQENTQALNVETIVGIVIGLLLVLTLAAALGCFLFLHRGNWPPASTAVHQKVDIQPLLGEWAKLPHTPGAKSYFFSQDVVPLVALSPRPPYLMPDHQLPSTRNYYAPTQMFTVKSTTKQMWVISSSRQVSLWTVGKSLSETQDRRPS
ncbi:carcinoembryonic antigen-related cell adhesion molecule 7-like isoform X2 [Dama dama]|uniref:carcinoembryonic antigen-related cell adhesion molecule 7-like isoform X2 n=1 Tax=Dama dama TaxID=30532 RepID=UPI002A361074|nr:carcinoembryonic antigen-related cell adhesion molecule 7-like isoform X2 [Dama dama]